MSDAGKGLLYTESHEWVRVDGSRAQVGITEYAQSHLGDVVFIELPAEGSRVTRGQAFGSIESVKAASDLYSPVTGTVTRSNADLTAQPEIVNSDPYGQGWMLEVELDGPVEGLLDEAAYRAQTAD